MRLEPVSQQANLPAAVRANDARAAAPAVNSDAVTLLLDGSMTLDEMEQTVIRAALTRSGDNVTGAARLLGCSRETLRYRVEKYGLKSDN